MGDDWGYQSHTGMLCQERGDLDRAQQLTERAQEQAPGNVGAAHTMAHLFHERGEATAGPRYLDGWIADHGFPPRAWSTGLWAAGKGDRDALEVVLAWDGWGDPEGSAPQPATVRAALEGAVAFAAGDHDRCIELIEPVLDDLVFLGGSHAQREVFEDTVIAAAMRAGRQGTAVRMLEERLARRRWRRDERLLASAHGRT